MEERFENFMLEKIKKGACVALQGGILGLIDEPIYPTSGRKTVDRIRREISGSIPGGGRGPGAGDRGLGPLGPLG